MKGRKRKPSSIKKLEGNPGHRPENILEPEYRDINADYIPPAPKMLNTQGKKEWKRICIVLGDCRILTEADLTAMAMYCQYFGIWIEAQSNIKKTGLLIKAPSGYPIQNPYLAIANKAEEKIRHYLTEFGMTPSSRSRLEMGSGPGGTPPEGSNKSEMGNLLD